MENMIYVILDFIFETRLGRFVFLMALSAISSAFLSLLGINFWELMTGGVLMSLLLTIINTRE